jgi:soluble lytic murein transglycosylase-like protein
VWLLLAVSLSSLPPQYMKIVRVEARRYGLDPLLVAAVIYKESRFTNRCCYRGSHGLMQIQLYENGSRTCKATMAKAVRLKLYDPRTNIRRGLKLMAWWRGWWRKHHRNDGYHWLLHYNQGFGRCPKSKPRCKKRERLPVRTGKVGGYADRVLKVYRKLKRISPGV